MIKKFNLSTSMADRINFDDVVSTEMAISGVTNRTELNTWFDLFIEQIVVDDIEEAYARAYEVFRKEVKAK